jgi:predicted RNase H-like HicB family nuclease
MYPIARVKRIVLRQHRKHGGAVQYSTGTGTGTVPPRIQYIYNPAMPAQKKTRRKNDHQVFLLSVEIARETDGRWIADIPLLPGIMAYGKSKDDALRNVQALALHVIADRLEDGELKQASISFVMP